MPTTQPLTTRPAARPLSAHLGATVLRALVATGILLAATALIAGNSTYRAMEASGAAGILQLLVGDGVSASNDHFWIVTTGFAQGFRVTAECTAVILVAPLLFIAIGLLLGTRAHPARMFVATLLAYTIVTVINELRLALIGWASFSMGMDQGYPLFHTLVGSVIGVVGFAAGLSVLVLVGVRPGRRRG